MKDHILFLIRTYSIKVLSIQESHLDSSKGLSFVKGLGRNWDGYVHSSEGASGGLILAWNSDFVLANILSSSFDIIHAILKIDNLEPFLFSNIYASTNPSLRNTLWNSLSNIDLSPFPWLIFRDFNCILNQEDKIGGSPFSNTHAINCFRDFITNSNLTDLGFSGPAHTWTNNRKGPSRILIRLDRAFSNPAWLHFFGNSFVKHLAKPTSDHCLILISTPNSKSSSCKLENLLENTLNDIHSLEYLDSTSPLDDSHLTILRALYNKANALQK
ncbi:hypothetical protein Cni_G29533 [Canna indica]|uniref:Endonuclease/exonuclease/phosphatase domain-containing protein n=1 Tax=Canna indica TaxID=4628 RepID=A0AAQ3L4K1_9LILI|nr:hypothetical protein Cni_G29533 [Canna indica]